MKAWNNPELKDLALNATNEVMCFCEEGRDEEIGLTIEGRRHGHCHRPHRPHHPCPPQPSPDPEVPHTAS